MAALAVRAAQRPGGRERRVGGARPERIFQIRGALGLWCPDHDRRAALHADEDFGALNRYTRSPGPFTKDIETAGWLPASHAAIALSDARTINRLEHALIKLRDVAQRFTAGRTDPA
ncbi:hypothetical protein [Streptomyces sp. NPDC006739]|uniref:hypothetical protein n=1 Tax=Streptomyces sp. NPDC006739 TaxID=3364763 RepID=UPI00369DBB36